MATHLDGGDLDADFDAGLRVVELGVLTAIRTSADGTGLGDGAPG
jgi:hypothetical protein